MKQISRLVVGTGIVILCLFSCKSSKDVTGSKTMVSIDSPDMFASRLKLTLPQEKKDQTINGMIKLVRNEFIQLSLVAPILRTEAIRIEITPREVVIIDRIHKQYTVSPIADFQAMMGNQLSYDQLQARFLEAVFLETPGGWLMRENGVTVIVPVHHEGITEKITMQLNRIAYPKQHPVLTTPSDRYEKKELTELIKSIEEIE